MKKFEIGKEYFTRSICDSECIFSIKITGRTAKTVSYRRSAVLPEPLVSVCAVSSLLPLLSCA